MDSIEGFILAGGLSRRMGQSKMGLIVGGQTLIERTADALSAIASPIFVVGNLQRGDTSLAIIQDAQKGHGAIVGLYTALVNAKSEWAAILACDLPFVSAKILTLMASFIPSAADVPNADIDAVLAEQSDGLIQPLCGLYRVRTSLAEVEKMLSEKNWRLQDLVKRLNSHTISASQLGDITGASDWLHNVNTPEDFQEALRIEGTLR